MHAVAAAGAERTKCLTLDSRIRFLDAASYHPTSTLKGVWAQLPMSAKTGDACLPGAEVLQLADVMRHTRAVLRERFGLEPAHFNGLPRYAYEAAFFHLSVADPSWRLELLTDKSMYKFAERAVRGGLCVVNVRHETAQPPPEHGGPYRQVFSLDVVNAYGAAMRRPLPVGDYAWAAPPAGDVLAIDGDGERGMLLEVDVRYPSELHDKLSDFPPLP
jgi:hypothetical protein